MSLPERNDLVTALRAVNGVADVELMHGEEGSDLPGDAGTLRIELDPGADEVSVATQVNQLLRQDFGLGVDSSRIQLLEEASAPAPQRRLAPVPDEAIASTYEAPRFTTEAPIVAAAPGGRLLIQRMQLVSAAPGVSAAVTLVMGGQTFVGEADGASAQASVHRSVAMATLQAVETFAGGLARFDLERVEVAPLGDDQVVLAVVTMMSSFGTERLIGASAVREDARQAVIRSTLDAINRRLEAVLSAG